MQRSQKPQVKGNVSLKNILGTTGTPQGSAWGEGGGGDFEGEVTLEAEPAPQTTGKGKRRGKQKQTLFTLGTFPN
jgi:hypothetical protein